MRRIILLLISTFFLLQLASASVTVDSNVSIILGNVTITFASEQTYDVLYDNGTYITLNDSKFVVSATNTTNISIIYYRTNESEYSFTATSSDPNTVLDIAILTNKPSTLFNIYRNGSLYANTSTTTDGWLNWTYSGGFSTWEFTLQAASSSSTSQPPSLGNWDQYKGLSTEFWSTNIALLGVVWLVLIISVVVLALTDRIDPELGFKVAFLASVILLVLVVLITLAPYIGGTIESINP